MDNYILEYHSKIKSGEIVVCNNIKKLYAKIVHNLNNPGQYVFDLEKGTRPIEFVERFCKQSKGKWIGQNFKLDLWQKAMLQTIFGFVDKEGYRKYNEVFTLVGRKNGKSSLLAAIGLYMLIADGEGGSEVYPVANKRDQARIIFTEALNIVRQSNKLSRHLGKRRTDIYFPATFSKFEPLASDSNSLDGLNTHFCIVDEIHAIKDRNLYDVMKQSMAARRQPLLWCITTAGFVRENIFDAQYKYAVNVIDGQIDDERFIAFLYELDPEDDFREESTWIKANPGLGTIKDVDFLRDNVKKSKADPAFKATVITKDFNIIGTTSEAFLDYATIRNEETFGLEDITDSYCVGGVDLSSTTDLTSATILVPESGGKFLCHQMFWMPQVTFEQADHSKQGVYRAWVERGLLELTPGNRIDYSYITQWFVRLKEEHKLYFQSIGYDQWNSGYWVKEMEQNGFNGLMDVVIQGAKTLSQPLKHLGADLAAKKINYNKNPLLEYCLCNLGVAYDRNNNITPVKTVSRGFIDGAMSLLDAYVVYERNKELIDSLI
jgi:phage terminase large subunit-like protein